MEKCQKNAKKWSSMPSVTAILIRTPSGLKYSEYVMAYLRTPSLLMESSLKYGNCSKYTW